MNQDLDIVMLLRYVLTLHELWGSSCVGICALLLAWVIALCFLRGYLRFASCVGICASRGFLTLMSANWPLMVVNAFFLGYMAPMLVNGFATA